MIDWWPGAGLGWAELLGWVGLEMLGVLRRRAGWFVAAGWCLFVVSVPIGIGIWALAGFNEFYFPGHRDASLDAFDVGAAKVALASGAFAAVASSVALALKFRATASAVVVAIWSVVVFGTPGARLFVRPGPEYFERHVGQQVFLVPWLYSPDRPGSAAEQPGQVGFSARLCLSNLKGRYDPDCSRQSGQLRVFPQDKAIADFDVTFWQTRRAQMTREADRDGYQSYAYGATPPAGGRIPATHYFVRQEPDGRLRRLVVCHLGTEDVCSHHARVGDYWLIYDAVLTEGDTLDGRLAGLIESWRRK